jgi:predicted sugar kinase
MLIEVGAPCCLPLGLIRFPDKTALLGIILQHPPVDVFAEAAAHFGVTGPRADLGYEQARRFLSHHRLEPRAEVEIELAIPAFMGLGSEAMLGLSLARALAWVYGLPTHDTPALAHAVGLEPEHGLELWGFDRGGLLLVAADHGAALETPPLRRAPIAHLDHEEAWSFVFHLPRVPLGTPATLEADRRARLLRSAPHLSVETSHLLEAGLWPALEQNDLAAFARALMAIQQLNYEALAEAGTPHAVTGEAQAVLDVMRDHGALAWGQCLGGLGLYGLVKGASASIELRHHLSRHVGIYGGVVMATITDNDGARHTLRETRPVG